MSDGMPQKDYTFEMRCVSDSLRNIGKALLEAELPSAEGLEEALGNALEETKKLRFLLEDPEHDPETEDAPESLIFMLVKEAKKTRSCAERSATAQERIAESLDRVCSLLTLDNVKEKAAQMRLLASEAPIISEAASTR